MGLDVLYADVYEGTLADHGHIECVQCGKPLVESDE